MMIRCQIEKTLILEKFKKLKNYLLSKFKRYYFEGIFFPSIELWSEYQSPLSSTVTILYFNRKKKRFV